MRNEERKKGFYVCLSGCLGTNEQKSFRDVFVYAVRTGRGNGEKISPSQPDCHLPFNLFFTSLILVQYLWLRLFRVCLLRLIFPIVDLSGMVCLG